MLIKTRLGGVLLVSSILVGADYKSFDLPAPAVVQIKPSGFESKGPGVKIVGKLKGSSEPSINRSEFLFAKQAFVSQKREEAIRLIRQQLDSGFKQNRSNLLLRLGQLYTEKYMELSYQETEYYTNQLEAYEKKGSKGVPPKFDNSRSTRYLKLSLDLFTKLEKEFPKHENMDEVMYFLGFVHTELGHGKIGAKYLEDVIKKYPNSRKYDEAVLYLGDYYFDKPQFKDALAKYQLLMKKEEAGLYDYALYKAAWCHLNLGRPQVAIQNMKNLVARLADPEDKAKFKLRGRALDDLVGFFADAGEVDSAMSYFKEILGDEDAIKRLKLMAPVLLANARDDQAIKAYRILLKESPQSVEAPSWSLAIYTAQSRFLDRKEAMDTLLGAINQYHPDSEWTKASSDGQKAEVDQALLQVREEGKKAALYYHHTAQKTRNKEFYQDALLLYQALVKNFPDLPERRSFAFNQAEIYYQQGKWLEASRIYMDLSKSGVKDKIAEESAYNALLALDQLTVKSKDIKRYSKEQQNKMTVEAQELPEAESRFIEVASQYLATNPRHARAADVKFRIASIYYQHFQFDKARQGFEEIALKYPSHRSATTAAHIVLDIYNIQKNYVALDTTAGQFLQTEGLGDGVFKNELRKIRSELAFKKIESFEKDSKWAEAGSEYLKYYRQAPAGPLAEQALYNAVVTTERSNDIKKIAEVSRLFLEKYPKHEYSKNLLLKLGKVAEKHFDFEDAKKFYSAYYQAHPKESEARRALYNAAVFAELLDQNTEALSLYEKYMQAGKVSRAEEKAILLSQLKIYEKQKKSSRVEEIYRKLSEESGGLDEKIRHLGELAKYYKATGQASKRNALMKEIATLGASKKGAKVKGGALVFVAEAKFLAIAPQRDQYLRLRINFPPARLVQDLKKKQTALKDLAASYDDIVELGVPEWGVAALYEKSTAYRQLVDGYRGLKVSGKYNEEERKIIDEQMKLIDKDIIEPLEKTSEEIVVTCVAKAREFHVVGEAVPKCETARKNKGEEYTPAGIIPKASYWTLRWAREGVARK